MTHRLVEYLLSSAEEQLSKSVVCFDGVSYIPLEIFQDLLVDASSVIGDVYVESFAIIRLCLFGIVLSIAGAIVLAKAVLWRKKEISR